MKHERRKAIRGTPPDGWRSVERNVTPTILTDSLGRLWTMAAPDTVSPLPYPSESPEPPHVPYGARVRQRYAVSSVGRCTRMVPKAGLRTRLRYWFDNTMSRGTPALVGWLAIVSAVLIVTISIALAAVTANSSIFTDFDLLWQTFVSAFNLDIPGDGGRAVHALWFLLALGGIFVVSALIGLLTSGTEPEAGGAAQGPLRGRRARPHRHSRLVRSGVHGRLGTRRRKSQPPARGGSDPRRRGQSSRWRICCGTDSDPPGNTRVVCRSGNPLDVTDLELVNLNAARSIIVLTPHTSIARRRRRVRAEDAARDQPRSRVPGHDAPRGRRRCATAASARSPSSRAVTPS